MPINALCIHFTFRISIFAFRISHFVFLYELLYSFDFCFCFDFLENEQQQQKTRLNSDSVHDREPGRFLIVAILIEEILKTTTPIIHSNTCTKNRKTIKIVQSLSIVGFIQFNM